MTTALIIVSGVAAGLIGLAVFLAYRWHGSNERAWKRSDKFHEADLHTIKLDARLQDTQRVLKEKTAEATRLAAALEESDEAYREQVELNIKDTSSPSTASALRLALGRLDRLRSQVPPSATATEAATAEGSEGEGAVHESDPEAPSEDG